MILVTGGAGYLGSHTVVDLVQSGQEVLVYDNLSNSTMAALEGIRRVAGASVEFVQGDIRDAGSLDALFRDYSISAVIHFAGLKAVGESVSQPLRYYDNNVIGSLQLFRAMKAANVFTLVFSSSATVYGDPELVPIREDALLRPTSPYGRTKLQVESVLRDLVSINPVWRVALLRYFNPVGAHPSGELGESPLGAANNLMPKVGDVAAGKVTELSVFGNDYDTQDGTGVRDYIHVLDLARGHLDALRVLKAKEGLLTLNLGTGRAFSVLELVRAYETASGQKIPISFQPRRAGDVASSYADPALAKEVLGWEARYSIDQMCADAWRWHKN